jgi:hypothetical protein
MSECPAEQTPQHEHSPGVVADEEIVCRGALDPMHFNKKGQVKAAFIRSTHLLDGELSIWRISRQPRFGVAEACHEIENTKPADQALKALYSAKVEQLRAFKISIEGDDKRAACVIDDCRTDEADGYHPEHAVIALSCHDGLDWKEDEAAFDAAREGLKVIFAQNPCWQAAA